MKDEICHVTRHSAGSEALLIAAPASNSGKTLVTLALLALMRKRGVDVAAAKVGPDYIDPAFHAAASGRECLNLDPWAMGRGELAARLAMAAGDAELLLVEGVMGLFDGAAGGGGSTAELAEMFSLPVVLVVDCSRQGQSVAALVGGFANFRPAVKVAGVILNRVASERHGEMLSRAIEEATGIPVVGRMPRRAEMELPARHLGLVQAGEHPDLEGLLERAAEMAAEHIALCRLANLTRPLAAGAGGNAADAAGNAPPVLPPLGQRLAVARDEAFAFCYPHMLADWRRAGAEMSFFSPLADEAPPEDCDAVFLPGGYPELHAGKLAAAGRFMEGLRQAAERGALVYGECGGFMVLGEELGDERGEAHAMAGLLPLRSSLARRRLHLGYRVLEHSSPLPFPRRLRGHEFHYATVTGQGEAAALFAARDARGEELPPMGLRRGKVCGSFAHVICAAPEDG